MKTLQDELQAIQSATGANAPLTHQQFLDLFTFEEQVRWLRLRDTASQTPVAERTELQESILVSYEYLKSASGLDPKHPSFVPGILALRSWGVLETDARALGVLEDARR